MRPESDGRGEGEQSDRGGGGGERAPAAARGERERNHQPELRLVGEKAEQDAGEERPAVELYERAAEQGGGEEAVLAVTDIDQHRREGEGEQGARADIIPDLRIRRRAPGERERIAADRQQIKAKRDRLPDRERDAIGHQCQSGGDEEKEWRIMPAVERRRLAEDSLLARVLPNGVERRLGVAVEHIGAGRVDVGKVRSQRPTLQVDEAVAR